MARRFGALKTALTKQRSLKNLRGIPKTPKMSAVPISPGTLSPVKGVPRTKLTVPAGVKFRNPNGSIKPRGMGAKMKAQNSARAKFEGMGSLPSTKARNISSGRTTQGKSRKRLFGS